MAPKRKRPTPRSTPKPDATLSEARAAFDEMEAPPPPIEERARATSPTGAKRAPLDDHAPALYHQTDDETGRKYRVEYLHGSSGKPARVRGRVALTLADLPPAWRKLPKLRSDGNYEHIYVRRLKLKELTSDDARTEWYQPMFKKRWTRHHDDGTKTSGVDWYARLGSYWEAPVAAVAAELAIQRYGASQTREQIEQVEADIVAAARARGKK